jgi:hypothetical protein
VATGLHLTGLGPAQQVAGLAQDILTNTEVMSIIIIIIIYYIP